MLKFVSYVLSVDMAAQTNGHPAVPDPMEVGNAFIKQYYTLLHSSPEHVHKFYQEGSEMSRPGPDGEMASVTTMQVRLVYYECPSQFLGDWN